MSRETGPDTLTQCQTHSGIMTLAGRRECSIMSSNMGEALITEAKQWKWFLLLVYDVAFVIIIIKHSERAHA